jgi:hypothetical protein
MAAVIFLCPSGDSETYEAVTYLACRQVHMVNPRTGKYWAPMKSKAGF